MNDERPIEKLLRRAAQKRRDEAGPPPELHPANRRLLQAEMAKQFPQPAAAATPPSASLLKEFWAALTQRWVYAVGVFVILSIAAIAVLPLFKKTGSGMNLAKLAPEEEALSASSLADESIAAQPAVITVGAEMNESARLGYSGGGNIMPPESVAPPAAVPTFTRADREVSLRREAADSLTTTNNLSFASRENQPVVLGESKTKVAAAGATTEYYSSALSAPSPTPTPASTAQRIQPTRSSGVASGQVGAVRSFDETAAAIPPASTKAETSATPDLDAAIPKDAFALSGLAADSATATVVTEGFADKTFRARGGGAEIDRSTFNSQAFSNVSPEQLARKKQAEEYRAIPPQVLVNFQIQQQGRDLRVIDGDGSVYNGVVDEENTLYKQVIAQKERQLSQTYDNRARFQSPKLADAVAPGAKQQADDFYLYRVEGTNRTLNQNVVFSWNFVPTNDALAAAQNDYKNALLKTDTTKLPSQLPALLQNSYINGRALFEDGKPIEVNAVPVK